MQIDVMDAQGAGSRRFLRRRCMAWLQGWPRRASRNLHAGGFAQVPEVWVADGKA
ncbi:MAG: hypothetical protein HC853_08625, partial [Anaerolineae bacterium]|nr:hypothetical protein [Anaerolineae bacterium]